VTDAVTYDDLVAAAAIGLSHSPLQVTALAGAAAGHAAVLDSADQAAALLDAAALLSAARRAGVLPVAGITLPPAAAADAAAELPAGAARLLRGGSPELLADLLTEAASRGYRAPAPLLPALLDAAAKDATLRPAVAAVLGARGRWLAQHRPDWQRVAGAAGPGGPVPAGAPVPGVWETGNRGERRAYLAALRERDPASARELLAAGWGRENGNDREDLIAVLARGLSSADEAFLEHALDDRRESVRASARRLLARLPDSALRRRAEERAARLLRLERHQAGHRLTASLPEAADADAVRDGIVPGPPDPSISVPAWLLTQLIAAAPLTGWVTAFGMDPGRIVRLPLASDLQQVVVHAGWRLAAISQASPGWAEALLAVTEPAGADKRPPAAWPRDWEVAAVLPGAARASRAAAVVAKAMATPDVIAAVAGCERPWPEFLADAVVGALRSILVSAARPDSLAYRHGWPVELANAAGRGAPVTARTDYAAVLARLADTENCPQYWSSALRQAADTIAVRRAFLEEIR
jgi:hypothetical protein